MKHIAIVILIISTGFMSGCLATEEIEDQDEFGNDSNTETRNDYEQESYVPIQEYTGEGFTLRDANPKMGEIAEEHRDKVVEAVVAFFLDNYKTEVEVHNIVSAVDGVSVFVESVGEPRFYSYAIVPIDIKNEEVLTDQVWSQEGQVESAINSGLYVMAYEDEFARLDAYLEEVEEKYPVVGMNIEVAENTQGNGYNTPYYFPKALFDPMYEEYLRNPDITKDELRSFLDENSFDPAGMTWLAIRFHMEEPSVKPDEEIYDKIYVGIEELEGIPAGEYRIILNDNYIDRRWANGEKESTLNKTKPVGIIKK